MLGPFVSYRFQGACVVKEISCGFVDDGVVARGVRGCPITANDANADSVLISAILGLDRALHGTVTTTRRRQGNHHVSLTKSSKHASSACIYSDLPLKTVSSWSWFSSLEIFIFPTSSTIFLQSLRSYWYVFHLSNMSSMLSHCITHHVDTSSAGPWKDRSNHMYRKCLR